jgi:hypothetical protein
MSRSAIPLPASSANLLRPYFTTTVDRIATGSGEPHQIVRRVFTPPSARHNCTLHWSQRTSSENPPGLK